MKKYIFVLLLGLILHGYGHAQSKLLVLYFYQENSPYHEKINKKILKNKYLARKINKNFIFKQIKINTKIAESFANKYKLKKKEAVYFIDITHNKILYSVKDLSKPCKCANLINYFSRKLYKKGITPNLYLSRAEKLKAYQVKTENEYLW